MVYTTSKRNLKKSSKFKVQRSKLQSKVQSYLVYSGLILLFAGLTIFGLTFYPVIKEEINYYISLPPNFLISPKSLKINQIKTVDEEFGILIPKIHANAKVIANVDPYNPKEYQWQLTKGVAHAKGSSLPDQIGNTFIFAHSSGNWYEANRYNSVFYLLNKLKKDDEIIIYYQKKKYSYKMTEKKLVDASDVSYLSNNLSDFMNFKDFKNFPTLTLMTCWPPGTTLKRLIVIAKISN